MKTDIHPEYKEAIIRCACGRETKTRAAVDELHVEICSHCHPFFTGKQKLVDTAGRVERFLSKYGRDEEAEETAAQVAERAESSEKQEMPEELKLKRAAAEEPEEGLEGEEVVDGATEAAAEGAPEAGADEPEE